jgi:hypothetical protein
MKGFEEGFNAELRNSTDRPELLEGCEDVLGGFAAEMRQIRETGVSLNMYTMKYMLVAALQDAGKQDLLSPHLTSNDGVVNRSKFMASSTWLRTFIRRWLKWTWRASTSSAQSTPADANQKIEDMLLRIAYLCRAHSIPSERLFMADETFAHLSPDSRFTFAPEGAKEVRVTGKDDKLGVTVMVTSSAAGKMLPMQAIASATTQQAHGKFNANSSFTELGGGFKPKASAATRKTVKADGSLAEHPPFYRDPATGQMIVAGTQYLSA